MNFTIILKGKSMKVFLVEKLFHNTLLKVKNGHLITHYFDDGEK